MELGTVFLQGSKKVLLLGSSGLLKLVGLKAHELSLEVINISSYDLSPASQIAHRKYISDLNNIETIASLIKRESPEVIIADLEEVDPKEIIEIENEDYRIYPNSSSLKFIIDKNKTRELALSSTSLKIPKFTINDKADEVFESCKKLGFPCVLKPNRPGEMNTIIVNNEEELKEAIKKLPQTQIIAEEYIAPVKEIAVFFFNYLYNGINTLVLDPVEYQRKGEYFMEAWMPANISGEEVKKLTSATEEVAKNMKTIGGFFITYFIDKNNDIYINDINYALSELALVTEGGYMCNVFELLLRSSLELPLSSTRTTCSAAMHLLISTINKWSPTYVNIDRVYSIENTRLILFGEPKVYDGKAIGAVISTDLDPNKAREKARIAASMFLIL